MGREELKERTDERMMDGEKRRSRGMPISRKMDVERGYEWEEGLFFLEEADPPEEPVTKRIPPDAADPRQRGRRLAEELPDNPGQVGGRQE